MSRFESLVKEITTIEPFLDEAMQFHPNNKRLHEGHRLRDPVCGFASNVLAKYLREKKLAEARMMIGQPVDEFPHDYPTTSRRHVVIDAGYATVDPTFGQFMALVGLDVKFASLNPEVASLYPEKKIAAIPRGFERKFGEQFADFALGQIPKIQAVRKSLGEVAASWPTKGACIWMPEDEAHELLADIWNPARYKLFDNEGDGEIQAQKATRYLIDKSIT